MSTWVRLLSQRWLKTRALLPRERRMGKPINFAVFPKRVLWYLKAAGLAVSVCGATVRPERGFDLGGWCIVSAAPLQEAAENPNQRWLGIPRCQASAASGGCQLM
ncbi:MAG: hypothetical protein F6K22_07625 [Okeania sp. SIO2F4]|uniref:hypothetical protein n=1 Tax=Okeania sp. SIO2F4 TaxID=2607790 RepID=UPI001429FBE3|nr:hypothetical protein [Okeania sp. SIO2F4]NES02727.1 hypothetical protein [Okeania sp. SIO2F4]